MSNFAVGISPKVLRWARERAGYSIDDIALKFKKDVNEIENWEKGENLPTYSQLEKLAYTYYKRPIALFYFPEPPEEPEPKKSFRTLPEFEIENLDSDTLYSIRQAEAMKFTLKEINDGVNPFKNKIFKDLKIDYRENISTVTNIVREYLGIDIEKQKKWNSSVTALENWRNAVEMKGIFIFKRSFKQKSISGFCLIDDEFPLIYLNNSSSKTRQIFSIFHELAHILIGNNGITKTDTSYLKKLSGINKEIEYFCNRFAGEFLVPSAEFEKYLDIKNIDDVFIEKLSNEYKVSREVILRKFLNHQIISNEYYEKKAEEWRNKYIEFSKQSKGGDWYYTQIAYLGENFLNLAFSKYYQGKFSVEQLADYLNIKVKNLSNIESKFMNKAKN